MDRRHFFHRASCATIAAAGTLSLPSLARPREATTFVLVHGAWHGAQHWARVVGPLTALGHRVVAIDLPAHGLNARLPQAYTAKDRSALGTEPSPVRQLSLNDAADAVINSLRALRGLGPTVLVGHSMAGNVLSRVGQREPALLDRLVYLAAFVPVRLPSPADYADLPESKTEHGQNVLIGDPVTLGAARIDPRSQDEAYLANMHAGYYGDVDQETFRAFANTLTPDLPLDFYAGKPGVTRERWGRIPRTYIRTALDGAIAPPLQDLFIREADAFTPRNRFRVLTLQTSHSPFASQPGALAEALAKQA